VALLPWAFDLVGPLASVATVIAGVAFAWPAVLLLFQKTDEMARKVMFASFFYLPIIQIIYLLDKI
jgi:protoheme IX farnesyltransferase